VGYSFLNDSVTNLYQHIYKNIRFEYVGDWHKLKHLLDYLGEGPGSQGIKRDIAKAQRDFLEDYRVQLIRALETSGDSVRSPFAPWSPKYKSNTTGTIGIRSRNYINALYAMRPISQNYAVAMQMPKSYTQSKSRKGGWPLSKYALAFEMGTMKQTPRPFWGATFEFMGGRPAVANRVRGAVGKRLKAMGINVGNI
jgi:hypothetical protein